MKTYIVRSLFQAVIFFKLVARFPINMNSPTKSFIEFLICLAFILSNSNVLGQIRFNEEPPLSAIAHGIHVKWDHYNPDPNTNPFARRRSPFVPSPSRLSRGSSGRLLSCDFQTNCDIICEKSMPDFVLRTNPNCVADGICTNHYCQCHCL